MTSASSGCLLRPATGFTGSSMTMALHVEVECVVIKRITMHHYYHIYKEEKKTKNKILISSYQNIHSTHTIPAGILSIAYIRCGYETTTKIQMHQSQQSIRDGIQWLKKLCQCLNTFSYMLNIIENKLCNILSIFLRQLAHNTYKLG